MAIPTIAMIPSSFKAGKLGSVLPLNGDGDFTFTRASSATRVNQSGLIEVVAANVPRLDYSDGTCPSLLLEPTATNIITYSEDFSNAYWVKNGSSVTSGFTSPSGDLSAFKLVEDNTNAIHILDTQLVGSKSGSYTYSFFAKKGENKFVVLWWVYNTPSKIWFDLESGVIGSATGTVIQNSKIENYGNGWFKCSVTRNEIGNVYCVIGTSNQDAVTSYQGNGTSGVYIYGAQLEENSYSTSYIKTVGTTQTRVADTANLNLTSFTLTSITETIGGVEQSPITVIPSTYTIPFGKINKIIMI